jgi:hypothetical protein
MKCTSSDERHIACQLAYIYIKKNSEDNNKTKLKNERHKGSNIGKRARWKNLRHPRERFLVSNGDPLSWRPIEIFPAGVLRFFCLAL